MPMTEIYGNMYDAVIELTTTEQSELLVVLERENMW
jgi:hypothetical protein